MTAITGLSYPSTCAFPHSATFLLSGNDPQVGCPNAHTLSNVLNPPDALRRTPIMACPTAGLDTGYTCDRVSYVTITPVSLSPNTLFTDWVEDGIAAISPRRSAASPIKGTALQQVASRLAVCCVKCHRSGWRPLRLSKRKWRTIIEANQLNLKGLPNQ